MRAALASLTLRGQCLAAAGLACVASAVALGQRDLLRVGVLLLALPLVAVAVVARTRYRLVCRRRVDPARVAAGGTATVTLELDNVSRLPTGVLLVEDTIPYLLGGRPRFVLDRVAPQTTRELTYSVRSDLRGRYRLGPLTVRLTDPFGLCELVRSFASTDLLVVTPTVTALPPSRMGGDRAGGGDSQSRAVAVHGDDDIAIREYRHGDDLRRVHWRSTARRGELMVRREEQPWQSRGAVLLDCRRPAHHGDGPTSSFEWAVSAAASVGVHLARLGYAVRLVTDTGDQLSTGGELAPSAYEGVLLDALAVAATSSHRSLTPGLQALRSGGEGLLVAIVGELSADDADELARVPQGGTSAIAVVIDTPSWVTRAPAARAAAAEALEERSRLLTQAGWRVVRVPLGVTLPEVWHQAAARRDGWRLPQPRTGTAEVAP